MSYDLKPKNKKLKSLSVGAFTWPIILQETGMGYVIGYGAGRSPASYVFQSGNKGSPNSNDGYVVKSTEAKMMARVLHGYIAVQRFVNKEWSEVPEEEKEYQKTAMGSMRPIYRGEVHEERLKQYEIIADFMQESNGFSIH